MKEIKYKRTEIEKVVKKCEKKIRKECMKHYCPGCELKDSHNECPLMYLNKWAIEIRNKRTNAH